jgi:hypothetical protein
MLLSTLRCKFWTNCVHSGGIASAIRFRYIKALTESTVAFFGKSQSSASSAEGLPVKSKCT